MANRKISELVALTSPDGSEELIVNDGGVSKKIAMSNLIADNGLSGNKIDGGTISNFTSTGIDDNATSTAITIDASENVAIGGNVSMTGPNNAYLNIAGAAINEKHIDFYHDSTKAFEVFLDGSDNFIFRNMVGGLAERMRIQSGGGISFNGDTAAANALDDYETGTWTPTFLNTTVSAGPNNATGRYTKIGNIVHVDYYGATMTLSGGSMQIGGLPFTVASSDSYSTFHYVHGTASASTTTGGFFIASGLIMHFVIQGATTVATWTTGSTKYLMVSGTYTVA